jgi:hypothetical protein
MKLEEIEKLFPNENLQYPIGFEEAVVGHNDGIPVRLILSIKKCLEILMEDMTYAEAVEFFDFNIIGAYVGVKTPLWKDDAYECDDSIIDYFKEDE